MIRHPFGRLLAVLALPVSVSAQVAIWGPAAGLRSGDSCRLQAGAASAAALAWEWSVLEPDGGTVIPDGDGHAVYTAPFVLRPRTFTVRASVASDRTASATLALRVNRLRALELVDGILGPGWEGPRLEPLAGRGGVATDAAGRTLAGAGFRPVALAFVDLPGAGLGRCWLCLDQRGNTLRTVGEDGRMALFAGREVRYPTPWAMVSDTGEPAGAFEGKGRLGPLDGPRGIAQFCGPLALAVQPATATRPFRILVTEAGSAAIRCVGADGTVGTFAGALKPARRGGSPLRRLSVFVSPWGLAADRLGNVYVADGTLRGLFRIDPGGVVEPLLDAGRRPLSGDFRHLALDEDRGVLYASDGPAIVRVSLADGRWSILRSHAQGPAALAGSPDGKGPLSCSPGDCAPGMTPGPASSLAVCRGLLFITEANGAIRVHDPVSGCIRQVTAPRAVKLDRDGLESPVGWPHFGPLGGQPPAFPGIVLALAFNDRGIGLVGSPDCLAELYLGEEALGGWACPLGPAAAPAEGAASRQP